MKKLAIIMAAIMLISLASVFCVSADEELTLGEPEEVVDAWNGTVATKFAGGNGTMGTPYLISNAAEWALFAKRNNEEKTTGKYYKLTADIVFNVGDATTWGEDFDGIDITPYMVGPACNEESGGNAFYGNFDGDGHTISGVYMKKTNEDGDTVGLFGSVSRGESANIKNLVITNSYFESEAGAVGALIGQTSGGTTTIKNVYVTDSVKIVAANAYVGGLVGHNGNNGYNDPTIIIDSCVNAATITATTTASTCVGGILGNGNGKPVTISNCLNMGDVSGYRYVSGIVGRAKAAEEIEVYIRACINVGVITSEYTKDNGKSCAIAWLGENERDTLTVEDCYYLNGTASFGVYEGSGESKDGGVTTVALADIIGTELPDNLDADEWTARGNDSVSPKLYEICVPAAVAEFAPASKYFQEENTPEWLKDYKTTEVFEIDSIEKFKEIANFVNGKYTGSGDFDGKTVKLTIDLIFNEGDSSTWATEAPENDMTDYIIGSWVSPFCGTFDGQNHTISGFYAKKAVDEGDTVAIIGCTACGKSATIENLLITNSYFESGDGCVAACVAQTEGGETTIKNIYVTNSVYVVSGNHYAGGIIAHVGQGNFEMPSLIVDSCVNEATVDATSAGKNGTSIGGILGNGNQKNVTISNCLNMGDLYGYQYTSGIIGRADGTSNNKILISKCINVGMANTSYTSKANELGKSCSIACFGNTDRENLSAEYCLYAAGTAIYGVFEKGETASKDVLAAGSEIVGMEVNSRIANKFSDWTLREGMIMVPTGVITIAQDSDYVGEAIETEPVETETEKQPETEVQPTTENPETEKQPEETKKPVETAAPSSSGGCGGFTVVATAILVAVAGFSTAIVIKQR